MPYVVLRVLRELRLLQELRRCSCAKVNSESSFLTLCFGTQGPVTTDKPKAEKKDETEPQGGGEVRMPARDQQTRYNHTVQSIPRAIAKLTMKPTTMSEVDCTWSRLCALQP